MAAEEGTHISTGQENGMANANGVALFLVIGEPFSDEQKNLISERITKSLRGFESNVAGFDLNSGLSALAAAAPSSEQGPDGEHVIEHSSDLLRSTVLINPQTLTFTNYLRSFLLSAAQHRVIAYSGQVIQGSGSWILQDDLLAFSTFHAICKEPDVQNALKQTGGALDLHFVEEGDWMPEHIAKKNLCKDIELNINRSEVIHDFEGIQQFTEYVSDFIKARSCKELLQSSDVVGNIRFTRPTLYVFPGSHGDSALFGISGFNLLVNAGYNKKACFWGFTRHLDRIDAMLLTHLGPDNIFGVSSVFERKAIENVHPEIGYIYYNSFEKKHSPNGVINTENGDKPASLVISLVDQANRLVDNMKQTGQAAHPCLGSVQSNVLQPLNLYHKVGHGKLDMYILNPMQDSKELKDFLTQWNKGHFTTNKSGIPMPDQISICAMLVWKPTSPYENITRILFPGNAPQEKVFEGLEKLKTMDMFKAAVCNEQSMNAPKGQRKPASAAMKSARSTGNARSSPIPRASPTPTSRTEPRRPPAAADKKPAPKSTTAASKPAKDAKNKKTTVNKEEKDKDKKSPSTPSTASKGASPVSESPKSIATPSNTPTEVAQVKVAAEVAAVQVAASLESGKEPENQSPPTPKPEEPTPPEPTQPEEPTQTLASPEDVKPVLDQSPEPRAVNGDLLGSLSPEAEKAPEPVAEPDPTPTAPDIPEESSAPENPTAESTAPEIPIESPASPEVEREPEVPVESPTSPHMEAQPEKEAVSDAQDVSEASNETDTASVASPIDPIGSPEALPSPQQFDAATFEAVAMSNSHPEEIADPSMFSANEEAKNLLPEAEQAPEEQSQEVPDLTKEAMKLDVQPERLSISDEDEKELPTPEEFRDESSFILQAQAAAQAASEVEAAPQQEVAADTEQSAPEVPPQQQADLEAEAPAPQAHQTEALQTEKERQQSLAEFGIYEDDTVLEGSLENVDANTLAELGLLDQEEVDQLIPAPAATEEAGELDDDSLMDTTGPDSLSGDRQPDSLEHLATDPAEPPQTFDDDQPTPVVGGTNPFNLIDYSSDMAGQPALNPFTQMDSSVEQNPFDIPESSTEQQTVPDLLQPQATQQERDSLEREDGPGSFDPLKDWGQPMGLPTPDQPAAKKEPAKKADATKKPPVGRGTTKSATTTTARRAATDAKKPASADSRKTDGSTSPKKAPIPSAGRSTRKPEAKPSDEKKPAARDTTARKPSGGATRKPAASAKAEPKAEPKSAPARGSATARKTAAPAATNKAPAPVKLAPVTPFYVDLSYIPSHGESNYVDREFFRKIRARYYVLSSLNPSAALLNALLEAKQTWEDPSLEVTVIPTYDTDTLRHWMGLNRDQLCQLKIDFAPSASRCTIQLQDHEASCAAYRLEF